MTLPVIALVQCGAAKLTTMARARDLYIGGSFIANKRAALRIADRWYILSALHGLVRPDAILRPYNVTLPKDGDPAWGEGIRKALQAAEPEGFSRLVALCSKRYLVGWAKELGAETPYEGLNMTKCWQVASRLGR